jgi:CRISPR-associated protein Cpf1
MAFYEAFDQYYIDYNVWQDYNLVRNYITKQKYKTDKFKLNFSNSQFLTGWDKDKEKERFGTLFRKGGKYYL